jgi:transposase
MARYKNYDPSQGQFLIINSADQLIPGTFEHTINYLIENKLDLSILDYHYKNDATGAPAYNPGILLKIILYSYSLGINSSGKMEQLCRTNIIMKSLTVDSHPHFTVLADYIVLMKDEIQRLFVQLLLVCEELDLMGKTVFAIDGCKLPSNAAKEWSGTFADLEKKKAKFEQLSNQLLEGHSKQDSVETNSNDISEEKKKRIENINRKVKRIDAFLKNNTKKMGPRKKEVQSNITDNESAKIKSSKGIIQGYNGIAVADEKNQVIVAAEAFGRGQEQRFFGPLVEQTEKNLKTVTGENDSGGYRVFL